MMIKVVSTHREAIKLAMKLSGKYAVMIVDNIYNSHKDFKGIIIKVGE